MSHDRGCPCGREPYEYNECQKDACTRRTLYRGPNSSSDWIKRAKDMHVPNEAPIAASKGAPLIRLSGARTADGRGRHREKTISPSRIDPADPIVCIIAEAWASIDGKLDLFHACARDQRLEKAGGYYGGYLAEAKELMDRCAKRGLNFILPESASR